MLPLLHYWSRIPRTESTSREGYRAMSIRLDSLAQMGASVIHNTYREQLGAHWGYALTRVDTGHDKHDSATVRYGYWTRRTIGVPNNAHWKLSWDSLANLAPGWAPFGVCRGRGMWVCTTCHNPWDMFASFAAPLGDFRFSSGIRRRPRQPYDRTSPQNRCLPPSILWHTCDSTVRHEKHRRARTL